jgi:hypothetical protein
MENSFSPRHLSRAGDRQLVLRLRLHCRSDLTTKSNILKDLANTWPLNTTLIECHTKKYF